MPTLFQTSEIHLHFAPLFKHMGLGLRCYVEQPVKKGQNHDCKRKGCRRSTSEISRCVKRFRHRGGDAALCRGLCIYAPYSQSAIGAAAVRRAYEAVFKAITLSVKFNVAETVEMSSDWVFARTNSAGTTTNHATGAISAEGNQELFIFKKSQDGAWKIARYSFSSTNPRQQ